MTKLQKFHEKLEKERILKVQQAEEHKIIFSEKIKLVDNDKLLDLYEEILPGDDYDGCFTAKGKVELDIIRDEFYKRLQDIGFIKRD